MMPTVAEVVNWLIVGVLAGSLAGLLVKRQKSGFGRFTNLGVGLVGALIGASLQKIFHVNVAVLTSIKVSMQDLAAALVGSLIFLIILWAVQKFRGK
jgi:uncharacterized membrane protein YeaQ/YmgE (transglycosylase-associated protein family)